MEPRPRLRLQSQEPRTERAVEHRGMMGESARQILVSLFALTTAACDPDGMIEEGGRQRGLHEARRAAAEAAAEQSPEAIDKKHRAEFKAKLVELEKAGYTVEISGLSVAADVAGSISGEVLSDMEGIKQGLTYLRDGESSVTLIETAVDPLAILQKQLNDSGNRSHSVKVPIYRMVMKPSDKGIVIAVDNWLTDQTIKTVTLEGLSSTKDDYATWEAQRNADLLGLTAAVQRDKEQLATVYGKLLTENGVSLNAMDIMRVHAGNGMEVISQLFTGNDVDHISINGFKHDRLTVNSPYIAWEMYASTRADLPQTGSPELPGTLTSVELYRSEYDRVPSWWDGHATSEVYTDKYGNTIMVETTSYTKDYDHGDEEPDETYSQSISINVPTHFLENAGSESQVVSWSVDLSKLGMPEITDFVYSHPESPIAIHETPLGFKFHIYYEGDDSMTMGVYDGYYNAAERGVLDMQYAFYGYEPEQQLVNNILIVPTNGKKNGYFAPRNSATIALTDGHMQLMSSDIAEVISTGRHETSHALFNHLQLNKNKEINDLHKRLSKDFFAAIAESNWTADGFGGHPQDKPTELFATFMNSLMVSDLEKTMRARLTPATAAEYAETAKIFRAALKTRLTSQNSRYETINILEKLAEAERIARSIAAGE